MSFDMADDGEEIDLLESLGISGPALVVRSGTLALTRVDLALAAGLTAGSVDVTLDGAPIAGAALTPGAAGSAAGVSLPAGTSVRAGQELRIEVRTNS